MDRVSLREVQLSDRYDLEKREVLLSGVQALVRLPLAQRARDRRAGLDTAGYVTGYRGSPLGAVDTTSRQARKAYEQAGIVFQPGLNEDLAATAVWGAQQASLRGEGRHGGVFALWYGKGPGVDRSGDVLRHANLAGTAPLGGVLCAAGDDHLAESSTTCHQTELAFADAMIPVLAPAGVQEVLDYGHAGWALSRYAGCWVALKCLKDTVEVTEVVDGDPHRLRLREPEDFVPPEGGLSIRLQDSPPEQEVRLHEGKRLAAAAFWRANGLDSRRIGDSRARFGVMAAGKSWLDVVHAFQLLGLDRARCGGLGISAYKVGMVWPLEAEGLRKFAQGLERLAVVEEKRALLETQAKEILFGEAGARIVGKRDLRGATLFQPWGVLDPVGIAVALADQMDAAGVADAALLARRDVLRESLSQAGEPVQVRSPWFCAGCPHNSSTHVPEGSRAYAGIGCHYLAQWMDRKTLGFTQMGGEGANWIGEAPFSTRPHVFQNMGDGTFNHSGSMAVRAALAAGVSMTFKLLFNDAVAMTGGQAMDGDLTADGMARICRAEGVQRIAVVSDEPERLPKDAYPSGCTFDHRRDLDRVQRQLREVKGVSLLVYVQTCAAEKRRRRRRGTMADPDLRLYISPAVCEGCGDCGRASNCVAILPKETVFGRKRMIDQSACNKDYSCLEGFCPSFVSVTGGSPARTRAGKGPPVPALPEPVLPEIGKTWNLLACGVGGTGVVTVGALLAMAAHVEGRAAGMMEMAGLAQKGGAVTVHCRIARRPADIAAIRVAAGEADALIAGDLMVATSSSVLASLDPARSRGVCSSSEVPTGAFALDPDWRMASGRMAAALGGRLLELKLLDASRLAEERLGDRLFANLVLLGAAWQAGAVPLSREAIHRAVEVNGVATEANRQAFELGRWWHVDPQAASGGRASAEAGAGEAARAAFLAESRDAATAGRFRALVERARAAEARAAPGRSGLPAAVAEGYFQLLSYKDEYEVARLHLRTRDEVREVFGPGSRVAFHLAPPGLARRDGSGRIRKRAFGEWILPLFRLLAALRGIRGTWLDPFGWSAERKMERALIAEYERTMEEVLAGLAPGNHAEATALARLPTAIRGFGHVKMRAVRDAALRGRELRKRFDAAGDDLAPAR